MERQFGQERQAPVSQPLKLTPFGTSHFFALHSSRIETPQAKASPPTPLQFRVLTRSRSLQRTATTRGDFASARKPRDGGPEQ